MQAALDEDVRLVLDVREPETRVKLRCRATVVNVGRCSGCQFAHLPVSQVPSWFEVLASDFDNKSFLAFYRNKMYVIKTGCLKSILSKQYSDI